LNVLEDSMISKRAKAKPVIATKPAAPSKPAPTGPQPVKRQK
jgi:hypothetical protein